MKFMAYRSHANVGPYGIFKDEIIILQWSHNGEYSQGILFPEANWKTLCKFARLLKKALK